MFGPFACQIPVDLYCGVMDAEPVGEHLAGTLKKRIMAVIARTCHMCRKRYETARDRPDMEVVDIRHVWQLEQRDPHLIDVDVAGSTLHEYRDRLANQ